MIRKLSSLTNEDDPDGLAKRQLDLLRERKTLASFTNEDLHNILINGASSTLSSFKSPIALREAEWHILEHVYQFSKEEWVRKYIYQMYQTDDEFRRGVIYASDATYLRKLRSKNFFAINGLTGKIIDFFRVSNWGEKDIDELKISATEDLKALFIESLKEEKADASGLRYLLHIARILENLSHQSHTWLKARIVKDRDFLSIVAIVSNHARPGDLAKDLPKTSWTRSVLQGERMKNADHDLA